MTEQQIMHWMREKKRQEPSSTVAQIAQDFLTQNNITIYDPEFPHVARAGARMVNETVPESPYAWRQTFRNN